jgi:hypothetical protein
VQYVGTLLNGIWTTFSQSIGGSGFGWSANGGGYGYTEITLQDGGTFQSIQFLAGSGGALQISLIFNMSF